MKKILILFSFVMGTICANSQVVSRYFPKQTGTIEHISAEKQKAMANKRVVEMPAFDVQRMLKEDKEMAGVDVPYRFGKGFDVSYTLDDGSWDEVDSGRVWSMTIHSKDALSLNFIFHDFRLPDGATLNIVNGDNTFIYGPVTRKAIPENGIILTDIIPGSKMTIYLYEPKEQAGRSSFTIKRVVHGYKGIDYDEILGAIGASHSCNVPAEDHPEYSKEYDAIALVMKSTGDELCSGSLLMTTDFSFTPYLLTAFHCLDSDKNSILSSQEKSDASQWLFKFKFRNSTYTGSNFTTGITFNGDVFRAAASETDFALLQLNQNLSGYGFTWLGWDKSGIAPTNGGGLHHPCGDFLKVSIEDNNFTSIGWNGSSVYNHWYVNFDEGITQGGSSGSPIFDQNKRVVGQLHGGPASDDVCDQTRRKYGKLSLSWSGSSASTRLSDWLDPQGTNLSYIDSYKESEFESIKSLQASLSGPDVVCNSAVYSLSGYSESVRVIWSFQLLSGVAPILQPSSNSHTCTVINSSSSAFKGDLVATAKIGSYILDTYSKHISGNLQLTLTYWDGGTYNGTFFPGDNWATSGNGVLIESDDLNGMSAKMSLSCSPSNYTPLAINNGMIQFTMPYLDSEEYVILKIYGNCFSETYYVIPNVNHYHNSQTVQVEAVGDHQYEIRIDGIVENQNEALHNAETYVDKEWKVMIYSVEDKQLMMIRKATGNRLTLDTSGWRRGTYVVRVIVDGTCYSSKISVK